MKEEPLPGELEGAKNCLDMFTTGHFICKVFTDLVWLDQKTHYVRHLTANEITAHMESGRRLAGRSRDNE